MANQTVNGGLAKLALQRQEILKETNPGPFENYTRTITRLVKLSIEALKLRGPASIDNDLAVLNRLTGPKDIAYRLLHVLENEALPSSTRGELEDCLLLLPKADKNYATLRLIIQAIENQQDKLSPNSKAYDAAGKLSHRIGQLAPFFKGERVAIEKDSEGDWIRRRIDTDNFQLYCKNAINQARVELGLVNGWNQLFNALTMSSLGAGAHYFILDTHQGSVKLLQGLPSCAASLPKEMRYQATIALQINALREKYQELTERGCVEGTVSAGKLLRRLEELSQQYFTAKPKLAELDFKQQCIKAIDEAKPTLEKHRGWKQVLANLSLAILGLGIGYLAAGMINKTLSGNFLFFNKTASTELLTATQESIVPDADSIDAEPANTSPAA